MSDYLAQVVRQRDAAVERARKAEQLLAAAEDELQKRRAGTPLICSDERHRQKVAALEAALAGLGRMECGCPVLNGCDCGLTLTTEVVRGGRRLRAPRAVEARP